MATDNKKPTDKLEAVQPSSAPVLTDDQKEVIEKALSTAPAEVPGIAIADSDEPKSTDAAPVITTLVDDTDAAQPGRLKRIWRGYWRRKRWTIPLTILVIIAVLAAIPATRYPLAGLVLKHDVTITVADSVTKKPVSSAEVTLAGHVYKTDKDGKVTVKNTKVGKHSFSVSKKYYTKDTVEVFVPLAKAAQSSVNLVATGRQVPVKVVNKVTGKPLENVTLEASGTEVKTDKDGKAIMVLPAERADLPITLSNGGYNNAEARIKVTDQEVADNTFSITPSGKVYFLSRQSGKIDVVKTDLDGSNRQTIVAGTGKEDDRQSVLLASRDWKYLAFLSKRDSGLARLYLIDTSTDKMSEMDAGDVSFELVGWQDHDFVYKVTRLKIKTEDANHGAIKSYNADKKQLFTLDQTASVSESDNKYYQIFGTPSLVGGKVAYSVGWQWSGNNYYGRNFGGKTHSLRVAAVSASSKKDVKTWPADQYSAYIQAYLYEPNGLYMRVSSLVEAKEQYYEYENGEIKDLDIDETKFSSPYPTYLVSPDGKRTFWSEQRDGREAFFVGDADGGSGKQAATIEDGAVYGWYGNDYVLTSKDGSQLYIMSAEGGNSPLKVSDYHKPQVSYRGYGGGYGGL